MDTPKLQNGSILLASSHLSGSYFEDTILLLVDYDPAGGSYGLILNHHSHMPIAEVFGGIDPADKRTYHFNMGGPVEESTMQVLVAGDQILRNSVEVFPHVYIGGEWDEGPEFMNSILETPHLRIFLGYTGWAPGQLEREVEEGSWDILELDPFPLLYAPQDTLQMPSAEFRRRFTRH